MQLREEQKTAKAIEQITAQSAERPRPYMGISGLGADCQRSIWMGFRWFRKEQLSGRVRRLLDRGHREEAQIVRNLKAAGVQVSHTGTKQTSVSIGPWIKGHVDGIIECGLLESRNNRHILEMKTSNDKAFKELEKLGMQKAKPQHYIQMQLYMLATGIERAFYYVVNKNDDSIYTERIKLDRDLAEMIATKGNNLAMEPLAPMGLSKNPTWYQCKMCQYWGICYNHETPEKSCRTCAHAEFTTNGKVICHKSMKTVSYERQILACDEYRLMDWRWC